MWVDRALGPPRSGQGATCSPQRRDSVQCGVDLGVAQHDQRQQRRVHDIVLAPHGALDAIVPDPVAPAVPSVGVCRTHVLQTPRAFSALHRGMAVLQRPVGFQVPGFDQRRALLRVPRFGMAPRARVFSQRQIHKGAAEMFSLVKVGRLQAYFSRELVWLDTIPHVSEEHWLETMFHM